MSGNSIQKHLYQKRRLRRRRRDEAEIAQRLAHERQAAFDAMGDADLKAALEQSLVGLNNKVLAAIAAECPENSHLAGTNWMETAALFLNAGQKDALKNLLNQCDDELWQIFGLSLHQLVREQEQSSQSKEV